ncbi:MAG TPA: PIN domain-containing protein [Mucilaginibacter sp.]|nr:PIN domain-containing protein [Mucilaginibacter sp.]
MSGSVFLDTNILIYAYSITEPDKQSIARNLLSANQIFISTQVLQELANTLNKKFKISWQQVGEVLLESANNFNVFKNNELTISEACKIAAKYKYSFYDSLIISAALLSNCNILYSEDMTHNHLLEGKLRIINPFV